MTAFTAILPKKWQPKAKAILAFAVPVIAAVVSALQAGVGWREAALAGGGVLLGLGVYATPNKPSTQS